jgi:hypothetical protein
MRILAGVCLAALALAACNKPAETAEAPAVAGKPPVPPGIDAAPHLKAGLWEISVEGTPMRAQSCIDDATQSDGAALGQSLDRRDCAKSDWDRIPGGMAFEIDCTTGGRHFTSKGTVTGDFNSAYRMEADVSGSASGKTLTAKQVISARYVGACPANMKPGDKRVMVNGQTLDVPASRPLG